MSNYEQLPQGSLYPARTTSSMALISLIAGLLGLTFFPLIGSIVAVITGPMAKKEIRENPTTLEGEGMATAGLALGWIGIGLSVIGFLCVALAITVPLCLIPFGAWSGSW